MDDRADERRTRAPRRTASLLLCLAIASTSGVAADDPAPAVGAALDDAAARRLVEAAIGEVEELRGLRFLREVPVEVVGDDAVREHVLRRLREFQPEEELLLMQRAYELLGLLPAGFDLVDTVLEVLRVQAGGFYDPGSGSFYLVDGVPEVLAPVVVVHELTHALEDQHFQLDRRLREAIDDDDALLARSAIHEGSATLLMTLYLTRKLFSGEIDAAAMQTYAETETERAEVLELLPPALQRQLLVPYLLGSSFLVRGDLLSAITAGFPAADVDRAYRDPPRSSEQILHPEKYWETRDDPRPVEPGDAAGRALGRGWRHRAGGVLGELTLGVLVGAPTPLPPSGEGRLGAAWTNAAAAGWGGDRWQLWQRGERAVVLLATVWDSPAHAREFAEALEQGTELRWRRSGDRVAVVAGDAGRKTERILRRMLR